MSDALLENALSLPARTTILLVEDDEALRVLTADLLRSKGYQVIEAEDGLRALSLSDLHPGEIHLVITDMQMPNIDGFKLIQSLASRQRCGDLKALVLSGYSIGDLKERLYPEDDIHFLEKPFLRRVLLEKVGEILAD